ncbi:hypothetical protein RHSIM_Rhsim06G0114500 [Rhododendron simsii]|uniref:Uncharacterized protein n=1 Tax=Rhododendron simsii TaxID=118357 RepID=A0A834LN95_RHOSS|nr:hypothetical protein RHSIM_Rhsim06G0114500 [Rhododendron simsii]
MAASRVGVLFLLLVCGVFLLAAKPEHASAKICPQDCRVAEYMICRGEKKTAACNCCFAGPGCTIYYSDGIKSVCS